MNIDLPLSRHIDNLLSRNMHSSIDGRYVYDDHCASLSSYQLFRACLLRDHVHYPSMNMRNLPIFLSTNLLDLKSHTRKASGGRTMRKRNFI